MLPVKEWPKLILCFLSLATIRIDPGSSIAFQPEDLRDHIAFLKKGDVWVVDKGGRERMQLTRTGGQVDRIIFSPGLDYMAYTRRVKAGPGNEKNGIGGDDPHDTMRSIVIENLDSRETVVEIEPPEGQTVSMVKWLPGGKLMFADATAFDVSRFRLYDVHQNTEMEIDYRQGVRYAEADYDRAGTRMVYVEQSGTTEESDRDLHLVDLATGDDRILLTKQSILDVRMSNDMESVAFVEVVDVGGETLDILWIYHIDQNALNSLYRSPAKTKEGLRCELSWSPEDRLIAMLYSPEAVILEIAKPEKCHYVEGRTIAWITGRQFAYSDGSDISLLLLDTGEKAKWIRGGLDPVTLP